MADQRRHINYPVAIATASRRPPQVDTIDLGAGHGACGQVRRNLIALASLSPPIARKGGSSTRITPLFMSLTLAALMLAQDPTGAPSGMGSTDALAYLDGVWTGPAWVNAPDGQRYEMTQTEIICPAVGGQVRLMEGLSEAGGRRLHHAVTTFEGHPNGTITMRAYTPGRVGQYPFQPTESGFEWLIDAGAQEYRYRSVIAGSTWHEVGEVRSKTDGHWNQMFEMTLERQPNDHSSIGPGCL